MKRGEAIVAIAKILDSLPRDADLEHVFNRAETQAKRTREERFAREDFPKFNNDLSEEGHKPLTWVQYLKARKTEWWPTKPGDRP